MASGVDFFRVLDASDAVSVAPPMVNDKDALASKKLVLHIPDKKGKPPEGEASDLKYGGAVFELDVPAPITCRVWVRTWWMDGCGNSLTVKVGGEDAPPLMLTGSTYESWGWCEVPEKTYSLAKGKHKILLLNREDGIKVDQILVTGDLNYIPQGIEEE